MKDRKLTIKEITEGADKRPKRGWWAPGMYMRQCVKCLSWFLGDKRAGYCADCAYSDTVTCNEEA